MTKPLILLAAIGVLAAGSGAAYLGGVSHGERTAAAAAYTAHQRALVDSIRIAGLVHDSVSRVVAATGRAADSARTDYRAARGRVHIVTDTTILVLGGDSLPVTLPAPAPLIAIARRADQVIRLDSLHVAALVGDTVAIARERDLWQSRALAAEQELRASHSRFGLKTGIAIGVTATLLIAKAIASVVR